MLEKQNKDIPKSALITGSSRRIGKAIALDLARSGTNIILHYHHHDEELPELLDKITSHDVRAVAIKSDLGDHEQTVQLFKRAIDEFGTVDLLINNASIFEHDDVDDFDEALWHEHFAVHLKAPSILSGEMAKQKRLTEGLIVNMIDQRVLALNPQFYSYTLSKSALWTATQTLAQHLAPKIRVNAIAPGPTLANERQSETDFQKQIDGLLLNRGPALNEFADTINYLWRTKSVTGQMIALDGGQHLGWETPDIYGINE